MDNQSKGIREQVSYFIGVEIPPHKWNNSIKELDAQGRFSDRAVKGLLLIALKKIEELENALIELKQEKKDDEVVSQSS